MRTLRQKSLAGAAALVLATFGLAGCSSNDSTNQDSASQSTGPASPSAFATARETSPVESGAKESAPPSSATDLTQDNFLERTTNAMLKAKSYHVDMTAEAGGTNVVFGGDMRTSDDPSEIVAEMTIPIDAAGTKMGMRVVDGKMYMQLPQTQGKWLVLDNSIPGFEGIEDNLSQIDVLGTMNETKDNNSAIQKFTAEPNSETIDGVSTTKLTLVFDAKQYMDEKWDASIGDTVTMIYFVGPEDLIRRIIMELGPSVVTMDMSNWGEPLDVTAPSSDEIITFEEMTQQQG